MIFLLGKGETLIYRRTPRHRWTQITANKPLKAGRKFTIYGMSQEYWKASCEHSGTEFIDPDMLTIQPVENSSAERNKK